MSKKPDIKPEDNLSGQRFLRLMPLVFALILLVTLGSSLYLGIKPLYNYAVQREIFQTRSGSKALESFFQEMEKRMRIVTDLAAQDSIIQEHVSDIKNSRSHSAMRALFEKVQEYQKNGDAQGVEVILPDGEVILSNGLQKEKRRGLNVKDWPVFSQTSETRAVSTLEVMDGRLLSIATANVRFDGTVVGIIVFAKEVNGSVLKSWSERTLTELSLFLGDKPVESTLRSEKGEAVFPPVNAADGQIINIGATELATSAMLLKPALEGSAPPLGSIIVATSLTDFFKSLEQIAKDAVKVLMPIAVFAGILIFMMSNALTGMTRKLAILSQNLQRILKTTTENGWEIASRKSLGELSKSAADAVDSLSDESVLVEVFFHSSSLDSKKAPEGFIKVSGSGSSLKVLEVRNEEDLRDAKNSVVVKDILTGSPVAYVTVPNLKEEAFAQIRSPLSAVFNNLASAITTVKLQQVIGSLDEKNREVSTIFNNVRIGMCMLGENLEALPEFSSAMTHFIATDGLPGRKLSDFLLEKSNADADTKSQIQNVLFGALGEDPFAFEVNSSLLPNSMCLISPDGVSMDLEVDWIPIVNSFGNVCRFLITLRDVTDINALRRQAIKSEAELKKIRCIMDLPADRFEKFRSSYDSIASDVANLASSGFAGEHLTDAKRALHTLKGNSRNYGFLSVANYVHDAEEHLNSGNFDAQKFNAAWHEARSAVSELIHMNDVVFGRKTSASEQNVEAVSLVKSVFDSIDTTSDLKENEPSALREKLWLSLVPTFANKGADITDECKGRLDDVCSLVGIPSVSLSFHSRHTYFFARDFFSTFRDCMNLMLANTIDHGLSKQEGGEIHLSAEEDSKASELILRYWSSEKGLALGALERKGAAKGLIFNNDNEIAELIFLPELSTAEQVSEVSGRGVGMNAVRSALARHGGSIEVQFTGEKDSTARRPFELVIRVPSKVIVGKTDGPDAAMTKYAKSGSAPLPLA